MAPTKPSGSPKNVEQVATASGRSFVQQAGRDLVNVTLRLRKPEGTRLDPMSVEPPRHRNKKVRGRDEFVALLEQEISHPSGLALVLHGGGGFGKTTLALEAARLAFVREMDIWWISASDTTRLNAGMREVALRLGIPAAEVDHAWSGRASAPDLLWRHLLQAERRWVLIIDDANEPQALAGPDQRLCDGTGWLRPPPGGRGTVVVTSRDGNRHAWGDFSRLHRVGSLDEVSGGNALLDLAWFGAGTEAQARRLSAQLGGLPLALHIAGTYLAYSAHAPRIPGSTVPRTFLCYGSALEDQFATTIDRLPPDDRQPRAETRIVTRTWELSLDLLSRQGFPKARSLMRFLACFAQAPVPYGMLDVRKMRSINAFGDLTPEELLELLHLLGDFGLIDCFEDQSLLSHVLTLHPLVRETNLHHLAALEVEDNVRALIRVIEGSLEAVDPSIPASRTRWLAVALHGGAPLALMTRRADATRASSTLARAAFLDYITRVFLEFDRSRTYLDLHRRSSERR